MTAKIFYDGRDYTVRVDMPLVCEIEQEIGSLENLRFRLQNGFWKVTDIVTLMHILLASCGRTVDYMELGNKMLQEGIAPYRQRLGVFLGDILGKDAA